MPKAICIRALIACSALVTVASAAADDAPPAVVVELFTAEGCSSCPPIDLWLQQLDAAQPIAGTQLIVLSEHVDYWNSGGWVDRYSSPFFTTRQAGYVRVLHLTTAYTPQMIVDGSVELHGGDPRTSQILVSAGTTQKVPVRIASATIDPGNPTVVRAHVEVDGQSQDRDAEIYGAVCLRRAESDVLRGENGGKRLHHVDVVQSLVTLGELKKGTAFNRDVELKLKAGTEPKNVRVVVFAQARGEGKIVGAAMRDQPE